MFVFRLSKATKEIISAIATYCDSAILGGMQGILRNWLRLADDVVYDILRSSKSNSEAMLRGLSSLDPPEAIARTSEIIENLQNYESARGIGVFNEFRALPRPDYRNPIAVKDFWESIGTRIEQEHRVDVQAAHPSELRAPSR